MTDSEMRVTVLGVGDAFDPHLPNSAMIVDQDGFALLIDCGPTVLPLLWQARPDPDAIDAIYLTHHHADHLAGLPSAMERWTWEGRQKTLTFVAAEDVAARVRALCAALAVEPRYAVSFLVSQDTAQLGPFALRTAPTQHVVPNRALRLEAGGRCFGYSGDGRTTPDSLALFVGADLLLHECWEVSAPDIDFHCDLACVREIQGAARIGLYHVRAGRRDAMREAIADDPHLFLLDPGDQLEV